MIKEIFIHSFEQVLPDYHLEQSHIVEWILKSHQRVALLKDECPDPQQFANALRRFCLSEKYIEKRYFECDELDENWEEHEIYRLMKDSLAGVTIDKRNEYFGRTVQKVFARLYGNRAPSHLIHVTCTGYISPSPAQVYFSDKKIAPDISHAYHMGCYASLPAIRMASGLVHSEMKTIDIVHTEMCSLHLNPSLHSPEQMVVQTLFADGHIKYSVGESQQGFKVLGIKEKMIPDSGKDMTWIPGEFGMMMTLSREVPFKIRDALPLFVDELCLKAGVKKQEILELGIFAIHPGGPKIIEAVQKKLELKDEQVEVSKKVLRTRGNMSSATLPHVWQEMMESQLPDGTKILSLAFGPGLTIFGSLFEVRT